MPHLLVRGSTVASSWPKGGGHCTLWSATHNESFPRQCRHDSARHPHRRTRGGGRRRARLEAAPVFDPDHRGFRRGAPHAEWRCGARGARPAGRGGFRQDGPRHRNRDCDGLYLGHLPLGGRRRPADRGLDPTLRRRAAHAAGALAGRIRARNPDVRGNGFLSPAPAGPCGLGPHRQALSAVRAINSGGGHDDAFAGTPDPRAAVRGRRIQRRHGDDDRRRLDRGPDRGSGRLYLRLLGRSALAVAAEASRPGHGQRRRARPLGRTAAAGRPRYAAAALGGAAPDSPAGRAHQSRIGLAVGTGDVFPDGALRNPARGREKRGAVARRPGCDPRALSRGWWHARRPPHDRRVGHRGGWDHPRDRGGRGAWRGAPAGGPGPALGGACDRGGPRRHPHRLAGDRDHPHGPGIGHGGDDHGRGCDGADRARR